MHKLLSASEVIPLMRAHLFHIRKAVKGENGLEGNDIILGAKANAELDWCDHQLLHADEAGVPLATRYLFPASSDSTLVQYADASREEAKPEESGAGAWAIVASTFVYVEWRWRRREIERFSINVLETIVKDVAARVFVRFARSHNLPITHSLSFTDNSTAENIAERGRATTEALNELNLRRQDWLVAEGIHQRTERVASIDNDVADLLSRGEMEEALRFAKASKLPVERLRPLPDERDTSFIAPTWA